jgi:hypothetical protein
VPDPWAVLGLAPGSSLAEARAARRRLAKQLHPDVHAALPAADRAELARRMTVVNGALAAVVAAGGGPPSLAGRTPQAEDSFELEALPVRAFELLFLVAYGLGEILDDDEPYGLEFYLPVPAPCFCRLELAPEAGGTIVTVTISPAEEAELPAVQAVRDVLVEELQALTIP